MLCEVYKVADGWQCGNCGETSKERRYVCPNCGAIVEDFIDEGTYEDAFFDQDALERYGRYAYDLGFDDGYQAREMELDE